MDKAAKVDGILVDLPPDRLEGYALNLLLKRVKAATDKQFHLAADGDLKVIFVTIFLLTSITNICH